MPTQVIMPQLGESVVEGTITKWLKNVGDQVAEFEPLVEINTDKVDTEVPSPASGVLLEILMQPGVTAQAGNVLAVIGAPDEFGSRAMQTLLAAEPVNQASAPASRGMDAPVAAAGQPAPQPAAGRDRDLGFISPVVARMASEHGVDLYQIQGTGQNGRITKKDLQIHIEALQAAPPPAVAVAALAAPAPTPAPEAAPARPQAAPAEQGLIPVPSLNLPGDEVVPHTKVRRSIADHMVMSERTSPHVTTVMEVDLSKVSAHRAANKDAFSRDGVNLTFTAYFVSAIVSALKEYPQVNSSWSDQGLVLHRQINIGMATSLGEDGLIVPVIKNADSLSLLGLARTINDLANRARSRKLTPDEVKGGTFTLTNHGISGSLFATPIINQPQCGILGVGAIQKRVMVIDDAIAIRPMAYVSLTFDHRILDGAIADYCLGKVVESLQNWK